MIRVMKMNGLAAVGLLLAAAGVAGCAAGQPPAQVPDARSCLTRVTQDLRIPWPDNTTTNIVAFGHSVPAGYGVTPIVHKRDAYPRLLEDALSDHYPHAVLNVITAGVGGENSTQGLARLQRDVIDHHPRVVLIDFALNDRTLGAGAAKANLVAMVAAVRSAGACPVLMTPTWDEHAAPDQPEDALAQQAGMIRQLGKEQGIPVADSLAAFAAYQGDRHALMAQFNHPNAAGHRLVLSRLLPLFLQSE